MLSSELSRAKSSPELNPFVPAWWLPGPHLPTLWAALDKPKPNTLTRNERLSLRDGDFVDLAWVGGNSGPLIIVLHGLEGSRHSSYVIRILERIAQSGWGGVLMHFRGCSGEPNRLERSYHSGDIGDISYLLDVLTERFPTREIMAIGYSLGGNVLLKYLGQTNYAARLAAATAVSVPFDLAAGATRLNHGFSRLYQWRLVRSLRDKVKRKFLTKASPIDLAELDSWTDFWTFDNAVTAPLHGFENAAKYYSQSSCRQYLASITTPTLIIHARDDPFLVTAAIPRTDELSASTRLELTDRGGHVGFVAGRIPLKPHYWIDDRLMAWLRNNIDG